MDSHLINLSDADVLTQREEEMLNCNMLDTEDGLAYENQDEEAVAMVEEYPSGLEMITDHPGTYALPHHGSNCLVSIIVLLFSRILTVLTLDPDINKNLRDIITWLALF